MTGIFDGLSRGVPGVGPRQMAPPSSCFEDGENIAAAPSLRYAPEKLFLGVIGAQIERSRTGERYAQGGAEIGIADDRHVITIAGSRAGKAKGRGRIVKIGKARLCREPDRARLRCNGLPAPFAFGSRVARSPDGASRGFSPGPIGGRYEENPKTKRRTP